MKRLSKMVITPADKAKATLENLERASMDQTRESLAYIEQQLMLTQGKITKLEKKLQTLDESRRKLALRHNELIDEEDQTSPLQ